MNDFVDKALVTVQEADSGTLKVIGITGVAVAGIVYACKSLKIKGKAGKIDTPFFRAEDVEFEMNAEGKDTL